MRLLHLYRPHLPLELATARASEPFPPGPLVLGGRPWDPGTVIDANPDGPGARRPAGDPARRAPIDSHRRRSSSIRILRRTRAAAEAAFEALAAFSPGLAGTTDPADAAFGLFEVQVDGLEPLWGPEPVLVERLAAALAASLPGRAGTSSVPGSPAPASPRPSPRSMPGDGRPIIVAPGGEAAFLAPYPSGLLTQDPDIRARLDRFGLRRIGAVAELARSALVARFGEEGARLHARARGEEIDPFRPRRTPGAPGPAPPHRAAVGGARVAPVRPPSAGRRAHRPAVGARPGRDPGAPPPGRWTSRSPGPGRAPSWSSSSASPNRPPTPRRSSASCSPAWSGRRRRPRSPAWSWSWPGSGRRPVSSSRCSCRRPPATRGSAGSWRGSP